MDCFSYLLLFLSFCFFLDLLFDFFIFHFFIRFLLLSLSLIWTLCSTLGISIICLFNHHQLLSSLHVCNKGHIRRSICLIVSFQISFNPFPHIILSINESIFKCLNRFKNCLISLWFEQLNETLETLFSWCSEYLINKNLAVIAPYFL